MSEARRAMHMFRQTLARNYPEMAALVASAEAALDEQRRKAAAWDRLVADRDRGGGCPLCMEYSADGLERYLTETEKAPPVQGAPAGQGEGRG